MYKLIEVLKHATLPNVHFLCLAGELEALLGNYPWGASASYLWATTLHLKACGSPYALLLLCRPAARRFTFFWATNALVLLGASILVMLE